ncbi:hypothetical protein NB311A_16574, partial [Nitrobacter sp. Nb-311A]
SSPRERTRQMLTFVLPIFVQKGLAFLGEASIAVT